MLKLFDGFAVSVLGDFLRRICSIKASAPSDVFVIGAVYRVAQKKVTPQRYLVIISTITRNLEAYAKLLIGVYEF